MAHPWLSVPSLSLAAMTSTVPVSAPTTGRAVVAAGAPPAPARALVPAQVPPAPAAAGTLSPSRAADFLSCPLRYRFRVIDRLPERPTPAATRGTVVHAVLDKLYDLPARERLPARASALVEVEWERLLAADPELAGLFADDTEGAALASWLTEAEQLVRRYFTLEDPRRYEPAERELYVETVLDSGLRLRGYVDRLDVAGSGDVRIVDYKTGRAPDPAFEARAMFQMRFYALVLWRMSGRVPKALQLLYLGSGEVLRYEPDEADLLATERKLAALWRAITRATATGDWRPSPSRLCDWCDHRPLCPAWGGTPPPLPAPNEAAQPGDAAAEEAPSPRAQDV